MKAIVKTESGIALQDVAKPTLQNADDVIVKVHTVGLCRTDLYVADGIIPTVTPRILGHEFAGVVKETSSNATPFKTGERVAAMPVIPCGTCSDCKSDRQASCQSSTMLGLSRDGAFAEYICLPASTLYRLPDSLSFLHGAYSEPVAAALAVLKTDIRPGQKGLIYGQNRISELTLLILEAHGFKDVAMTKAFDEARVKAHANSYDFIIETLATSETMRAMQEMIRPQGRIILKSRQHHPVAIDINKAVIKETVFDSVNYGDFRQGIDLMASKKLKLDHLFGAAFGLEQYREMFEAGRSGESKKLFCVMD